MARDRRVGYLREVRQRVARALCVLSGSPDPVPPSRRGFDELFQRRYR